MIRLQCVQPIANRAGLWDMVELACFPLDPQYKRSSVALITTGIANLVTLELESFNENIYMHIVGVSTYSHEQ